MRSIAVKLRLTKIDYVVTMKKFRWKICWYNENVSGRISPDPVLTNVAHTSVINRSATTNVGGGRTLPVTGPLHCVGSVGKLPPECSATLASCRRDTSLADHCIT